MEDDKKDQKINIPTNPRTSADQLALLLAQVKEGTDNSPIVFPYVISFRNGQHKRNWAGSLPDAAHRKTISEFWTYPRRGKKTILGLFSTEITSWVGNLKWDEEPWHCWAVAVIQGESGKKMIIYDPDPATEELKQENPRALNVLKGIQHTLFQWVRTNKAANIEL